MTDAPVTPTEPGRRSVLVTVIAWIAIAWSALSTLVGLWKVTLLVITPAAIVSEAVSRVTKNSAFQFLPSPYQLLTYHPYLVNSLHLAWWATVLAVSIGVLRRKEWARRAFVGALAVEVALATAGVVLGLWTGINVANHLAAESPTGQVNPGLGSGLVFGALLGIGMVAVLVSLLLLFASARVRAECHLRERAA